MRALETAQNYFFQTALPRLEADLPGVMPVIAAGWSGRGSECWGFDDDISHDHDFAIGFALYLTREAEAEHGFALGRFYTRLLKEFPPEQFPASLSSKLGGSEHGVIIIEDFFERHLGFPGAPQSVEQWLYTPEYALAEAVNGAIFLDNANVISRIRRAIAEDMPEDVRLKKLAARAVSMAQSGQYNFMRCTKHNEPGAAMLYLSDFVRSGISMVFLLNRTFAPYSKWALRAMKSLLILPELSGEFEHLLAGSEPPEQKAELVENICAKIIGELKIQQLSNLNDDYLEAHAFEIMKHIKSRRISSLHIMEG